MKGSREGIWGRSSFGTGGRPGVGQASGRNARHGHGLYRLPRSGFRPRWVLLRELMRRMGHSSTRAAVIYLHARDEREREIADKLGPPRN